MFTGIVEQQGLVLSNQHTGAANRLVIRAAFEHVQPGESIAINGVCLTLLDNNPCELMFDVSPETLARSTLGTLQAQEPVNLERAPLASTRMGGHYVSGHVDTVAKVEAIEPVGAFHTITISQFDVECAKMYLLPKGSIALDGVSLTINTVIDESITLMLVPHTLQNTTLGQLYPGKPINVEFDYITRIVAHQMRLGKELYKVTA